MGRPSHPPCSLRSRRSSALECRKDKGYQRPLCWQKSNHFLAKCGKSLGYFREKSQVPLIYLPRNILPKKLLHSVYEPFWIPWLWFLGKGYISIYIYIFLNINELKNCMSQILDGTPGASCEYSALWLVRSGVTCTESCSIPTVKMGEFLTSIMRILG